MERLIVNGSFATDEFEPNDVDCVLLANADFPQDTEAEAELIAGLPFLQIDVLKQKDFDVMVEMIFATDRRFPPERDVGGDSMELKDEYEVEVTRSKLKVLEQRFEASRLEPAENAHLQELSLRSLKRMINQLKEEIARFESHAMHGSAS